MARSYKPNKGAINTLKKRTGIKSLPELMKKRRRSKKPTTKGNIMGGLFLGYK